MESQNRESKVLVCCAPSGSGKSTLIEHLLQHVDNLQFSISATSRPPRGKEQNGVEYYFLTPEEFRARIDNGDFLEYCEVYENRFYGTLKSEVDAMLKEGKNVVCDVDVIGAENIKKIYGDRALTLFIQPPSIEELRRRLESRGTDVPEVIDERVRRAAFELSFAPKFDTIVVNDDLALAKKDIVERVETFLNL